MSEIKKESIVYSPEEYLQNTEIVDSGTESLEETNNGTEVVESTQAGSETLVRIQRIMIRCYPLLMMYI